MTDKKRKLLEELEPMIMKLKKLNEEQLLEIQEIRMELQKKIAKKASPIHTGKAI